MQTLTARTLSVALQIGLVVAGTILGIRTGNSIARRALSHVAPYEDIYVRSDDPVLDIELRADANRHINSHGFFGREYTVAKPPGTWRVVGLGDSVAMYGSAKRTNHYALLERYLPPLAGRPVEVLNLAVASYETPNQVRSLERTGLQFDPDFIVVSYCVNDGIGFAELARSIGLDASNEDADDFLPLHERIVDELRSQSLDSDTLHAAHVTQHDKWTRSMDAFARLAEIATERGIPVLVVLFPALIDLDDYYLAATHDALRQRLHEFGFQTLDLTQHLRDAGPDTALRAAPTDALHPNILGYAAAGGALRTWFADHRPWEESP